MIVQKLKINFYEICVRTIESLGLPPTKQEAEFEIYNSPSHWISDAKKYYNSAKVLERNYLKVLKNNSIYGWNKRHKEADSTFKVILYLYSMSIECILKAKILAIYTNAYLYLDKKNAHITKYMLKKWVYTNIYTHETDRLARLCNCYRKSDDKMFFIITHFIKIAKYPVIKRSDIHKLYTNRRNPINDFWTIKSFKRFDAFTLKVIKRCFGKKLENIFSEQSVETYNDPDLRKANPVKRNSEIIQLIRLCQQSKSKKA